MNRNQAQLMDHYQHPRNTGSIEAADFASGEHNPSCGDSIAMQGQVQGQVLVRVAFVGKGCVISQASASMLTEYCQGKNLDEIMELGGSQIQSLVGLQLGPTRLKCALLGLSALKSGIALYKSQVK
jgi:nitrogen fixation protein NifU and related proteins